MALPMAAKSTTPISPPSNNNNNSTTANANNPSKSSSSFSLSSCTRATILKSLRRFTRTIRTELRLFWIRRGLSFSLPQYQQQQQPYHYFSSLSTRAQSSSSYYYFIFKLIIILSISLFLIIFLFRLLFVPIFNPVLRFYEPRRETQFIRRHYPIILPRPSSYESIRSRSCSWLYLEFGARDGRHVDGFFTDGNKFLEEYLRATQSASRAFCALAFEPDPQLLPALHAVRSKRGRRAKTFDVFTQFVPGARDGTEMLKFRNKDSGTIPDEEVPATSIPLRQFLYNVTFPYEQSGNDVKKMVTARGNGNKGIVIVRFNDLSTAQALWYLDLLEANSNSGVLCTRVDRLILDFEQIRLDVDSLAGTAENRDVVRDWARVTTSPTHKIFQPSDDMSVVVRLAKELNARDGCRTTIHVLDGAGKMLIPDMILSERAVYYAILAGEPTFNERVAAQTNSWMQGVSNDRLTIFTNAPRRSTADLKAANGRDVAVVHPYRPEIETHLSLMQSWSHLVRTRETWDRAMRDDPSIQWLALVDDDTFVFPDGLRQYLASFDSRVLQWGGSGEQARIDNGDTDQFAKWLRRVHKEHGGKHCYLKTEYVPKHLKGIRFEYGRSEVLNGRRVVKKISHMCHDTFCLRGCPAVPQGAAIFLSRSLVEAIRPHIESCERDTAKLCKNCGSQRLFMCVNRFITTQTNALRAPRTLLTRGICRAPWKLEHREHWPFVLTYHGFNRYHGFARSTNSIAGDMHQLWILAQQQKDAVRKGLEASNYVPIARVADAIACSGHGKYQGGFCYAPDGKVYQAHDGVPKSRKKKHSNHRQQQQHVVPPPPLSAHHQQEQQPPRPPGHVTGNQPLPPPPPPPSKQQ